MDKKKAFTLTELLVVVLIIGILSSIVLPKFTKTLETRKVTEAEDIMAAVRNEQEARCTLGKDYTGDASKLASLPSGGSKHFDYTLDKQGITATSLKGGYVLQIPSYTDGRICCASGCDKLNKDYPVCDELDLEKAICSAPEPVACSPDHNDGEIASSTPCECGGYKYTRYVCKGGNWTTYEDNQCETCITDCDPDKKPATEEPCKCGKKTRKVTCSNSKWTWEEWDTSACNNEEPPQTTHCLKDMWCPDVYTYSCDQEKGTWFLDLNNIVFQGCQMGSARVYASCTHESLCNGGYLGYTVRESCDEEKGWVRQDDAPHCIGNTGFLCECRCGAINHDYKYNMQTGECTCANGKTETLAFPPDKLLWRIPDSSFDVSNRSVDITWTMEQQQLKMTPQEREEYLQELLKLENHYPATKEEYCEEIRKKYGNNDLYGNLSTSFPECY